METNGRSESTESESELQLISLSIKSFKVFAIIFCGYVLGYFGLSIAWILIAVFVWVLRYKYFIQQTEKVNLLRSIASNEKLAITSAIKDLPSWVHFPDRERAEWINKIMKQMWPFIHEYMKTVIKQSIEPNITSALPDYLKSFKFEKLDLGYAGNCDIQVRVKGMKAGIKNLQLYGLIRVELRPLLKDIPLVGSVSFYFLNNPAIDFNLTNLADILDTPGVSNYLRHAIQEKLAALMVLPNKIVVPLIDGLSMKSIKFLAPIGVIRMEVIEARNLKKSDVGMLGLGKSDPYVRLTIGSQEFKSPVIYNTVNPKWNYICEAVVHHLHDQNIEIEVMDEDQGSKDDFLGRAYLSLKAISAEGMSESWLTLKDIKTGAIHVRTTWFALSDCMEQLNDSIEESKLIKCKYSPIGGTDEFDGQTCGSVAVITVYLDGASNLAVISKTSGEPDPYCLISVGGQQRQSIVQRSTANPIWEETFNFLIQNFNQDLELTFDIIDSKTNRDLGRAQLKLQNVISCDNLSFSQPLAIKGRGPDSKLNVNIMMRILKPQTTTHTGGPPVILEEPVDESEETKVPTLEDIIRGTVQPIIDTSGLKTNFMDKSQMDRKHSVSKANGSKAAENTDDYDECDYPRIQLTITPSESDNRLSLIVHKAENLPKIGDKTPNPYVKIFGTPDKISRTLRDNSLKTGTKRNTCHPIFDENFQMDRKWKGVEIVVYSRSGSSHHVFKRKAKIIGLATIEFTAFADNFEPIKEWYDLEQLKD
ncbi:unnamed protein product [Oppiella nova]|uniref:C2 domain-containing protein n=1 Tax=Oppiella nova TaxID=334625 RepID=A0A7R9LIC6_9ACAR|nr:unnamed protein product [Oppiella nova]CAG2163939.1 unnamed protein product [Oppiella nova]